MPAIASMMLFLPAACGPLNRGFPGDAEPAPELFVNLPANSPSRHSPMIKMPCLAPSGPVREITWGRHHVTTAATKVVSIASPATAIVYCQGSQQVDSILQEIVSSVSTQHAALAPAFLELTGQALPPVSIDLFPVYEDARGKVSKFVTDNASYDPSTARISLYPSSKNLPGTVHLWNAPFIHAHEMGHHVLDQLRVVHAHRNANANAKTFDSAFDAAFDEACADALAFLATGSNPQLIRELPGFGFNRDPSWPSSPGYLILNQLPVKNVSSVLNLFVRKNFINEI